MGLGNGVSPVAVSERLDGEKPKKKKNLLKCIEIFPVHISGYRRVVFCFQSLTVICLY